MFKEREYKSVIELKSIFNLLKGEKFLLDCGHKITFGHNFGNNITIYNGKELEIKYSCCGY